MTTLAQAEEHRQALADVSTLAIADLVAVFRQVDPEDAAASVALLERVLPDLAVAYGDVAASVAADWYEDVREAAGAPGTAPVALAAPATTERAQVLARWGAGLLFGPDPRPDVALSKISGGLQRLVASADRDTIAATAARDRAARGWARSASANACAFCRMLTTRGGVYTEATATTTRSGQRYHDACHCLAVPVFTGQEPPRPAYYDTWQRAYEDAAATSRGTSAVLAAMRQSLGTN